MGLLIAADSPWALWSVNADSNIGIDCHQMLTAKRISHGIARLNACGLRVPHVWHVLSQLHSAL